MIDVTSVAEPRPPGQDWTEARHAVWADTAERMLRTCQRARERLGMAGLPELDAGLRARALDRLTDAQFKVLAALPEDRREGQIRALEAAERRTHSVAEVAPAGRSEVDDRVLYRWRCVCGWEAGGDYFAAEAARQGHRKHAGLPTESAPDRREAERPSWYRSGSQKRSRPTLEPTEE
jgi:hypothetical protein